MKAPQFSPAQHLGLVTVVVNDYDEAMAFYVDKLGFQLVEDVEIPQEKKRWVVVAPRGADEGQVLLARATTDAQRARIGNQTGGRVAFFLYTDDCQRDFETYQDRGVEFVRPPQAEPYGTVAVFRDLYGNLWDLLEPAGR